MEDITLDHIIPVARGGRPVLTNYVAACKPCNCARRAASIQKWAPHAQAYVQAIQAASLTTVWAWHNAARAAGLLNDLPPSLRSKRAARRRAETSDN